MAAASANAQFYKGFGIKAGTSIANQNITIPDNSVIIGQESDYNDGFKYKFGLTIGIFKEIPIIQNLKAQIGINYARKGKLIELIETNEIGMLTGNTSYIHENFDFITAELYGKYNFLNSRLSPYILAGLRLDFYLSQHGFYRSNDGTEIENEIGLPVTNNKLFGASLGAGIDYQASKLFSLFLEGTYNPDITYIVNPDSSNLFKYRGRSFDIRTGIKF